MRPLAVVVIALSLVGASAPIALAQTAPGSPPTAPARPDAARPEASPPAPGAVETPAAPDDPAALPRAPRERTTIFGMSPTGAIIVAASLLVVVILAVVAMTRGNDAYIDLDR